MAESEGEGTEWKGGRESDDAPELSLKLRASVLRAGNCSFLPGHGPSTHRQGAVGLIVGEGGIVHPNHSLSSG